MKHNLKTIKEQLKYHLPTLKKDFSVEGIGIFGSVAQGRDKPTSDVDILVDFSRTPGFIGFMKLEEYLSHVLGKKVDLVTKNALKEVVKDDILRQLTYV